METLLATIGGLPLQASSVLGSLGSLVITGDLATVNFGVSASAAADARIGRVFIGGSLLGGSDTFSGIVFAKGNIGSVTVRGSVIGGKSSSGLIVSDSGTIGSLRIGILSSNLGDNRTLAIPVAHTIFPGFRFAPGSTPLNSACSIATPGAEMSSSSQRACSVPTAW